MLMSTVYEIEQAMFRWAPKETAATWDNVGHLIGRRGQEVKKLLVALDITQDVAEEALNKGVDLIVSHHPVMNCAWSPVQTVRDDTQQGRLLLTLLQNNISAICMHTNLDAAPGGVNDALAARLDIKNAVVIDGGDGIVRAGELESEIPLQDFLACIRDRLQPNGIRYADGGKSVHRVAVGGGACSDYFPAVAACGCDTFVTSDVKYNHFIDAAGLGLTLIDAGHYPTEDCVCSEIIQYLSAQFPHLMIEKSGSHREIIQYFI